MSLHLENEFPRRLVQMLLLVGSHPTPMRKREMQNQESWYFFLDHYMPTHKFCMPFLFLLPLFPAIAHSGALMTCLLFSLAVALHGPGWGCFAPKNNKKKKLPILLSKVNWANLPMFACFTSPVKVFKTLGLFIYLVLPRTHGTEGTTGLESSWTVWPQR